MPREPLKETALFRNVSDLIGDLADLFQKELRLAKAEITANLVKKLQAGMWMSAAGVLGLLALLLLLQAMVFGLVALGLAPHWSCLLVAVVLGALGAAAYYKGRLDASRELTPRRTLHQIREDIRSTKEQLV